MARVVVVVTARPSWAKLQTLCEALRPQCDLQIVTCASALLERYGRVVDVIEAQGFPIADRVYSVVEGNTLETSALETGALLTALATSLRRLAPDVVVVCADRHEVLAAAQAAAYLHIPLAHLQGGERTGSIDDKVRHAITALADWHYPATSLAASRVGAESFGCPSIDLALRASKEARVKPSEIGGAGAAMDRSLPLVVWLQHPVTTELADIPAQWMATAQALERGCYDVLSFWPSQDAGADAIAKSLRCSQDRWHTVRNLPPMRFLKLLTQAAVVVGNSSAGIRECAALGVPVVNIGTRQQGRERAANVIDVPHDAGAIYAAIETQRQRRYDPSPLYGDGRSGRRIANDLLRRVGVDSRASRVEGHSGEKLQTAS